MTIWVGPPGFPTPVFDPGDPQVCHTLTLRPSIWAVVFTMFQVLGYEISWVQDDPLAATPEEVTEEVNKATDAMAMGVCMIIGAIVSIATDTPEFCLLCDGTEYANDDYPELAAVIDPAYHTDATHFRVPDLQSRFQLGSVIMGDSGGESSVTLSEGEMPTHTHTEIVAGALLTAVGPGEIPVVTTGAPGVTGATGGGGAHNNMPPYETVNMVIIARRP